MNDGPDYKPAFQGEMMLAGWNETHTGGAKVTFWLPDKDALDVFRAMTVRKGNVAGQRFMAVLVELGPDERPVKPAPAKGGPIAKLAGQLCANEEFCRWLERIYPGDWTSAIDEVFEQTGKADPDEIAAETIRTLCQVSSRAELDHDLAAELIFHQRIRLPWAAHCNRPR